MPKRYYEDEIPTRPDIRTHSDPHYLLGRVMAENQNLRKRVEALEGMVFGQERTSDKPPSRDIIPKIKKAVTYTVLIFAGVISAIRELGLLK